MVAKPLKIKGAENDAFRRPNAEKARDGFVGNLSDCNCGPIVKTFSPMRSQTLEKPRRTRQREAIAEVFHEQARPLRVEEIYALARDKAPRLGIATVYRNLRRLIQDGEICEVTLPEIGTLYELAGIGHHHHFFCRACGRLFDLEGCPLLPEPLTPDGFSVEDHEVFLYGVCRACNEKTDSPTSNT